MPQSPPEPQPRVGALRTVALVAFAASGAAALVFEVTWTRTLSTVMGSSTYALSTMLAAFMAGLSLGGMLGAIVAERARRIVVAFALCELGIGVLGFAINPIIRGLTPLYVTTYYSFHESFVGFSIAQFLIAFLVMGVPTTLTRALGTGRSASSDTVPRIWEVNF